MEKNRLYEDWVGPVKRVIIDPLLGNDSDYASMKEFFSFNHLENPLEQRQRGCAQIAAGAILLGFCGFLYSIGFFSPIINYWGPAFKDISRIFESQKSDESIEHKLKFGPDGK